MDLAMDFLGAKKLSDTDLTAALHKAITSERSNIAASIACLIEITARDLHTRLGAPSLFVYLTRDMKLSESSASKRCAAVRAIRNYPQILSLIQCGRLHLSNISMISRHLTRENSGRLIAWAQNETQRGLEKKLALEFPLPARRDTIRPVVYLSQSDQSAVHDRANLQGNVQKNLQPNVHENIPTDGDIRDDDIRGEEKGHDTENLKAEEAVFLLAAESTKAAVGARLHVTLNPEAAAALEFLAQSMPGKSISDILSLAVGELRKRRELASGKSSSRRPSQGQSQPPSQGQSQPPSESKLSGVMANVSAASPVESPPIANRYIPAALRREVAQRDGHRCRYVASGYNCPDGSKKNGTKKNGDAITNNAISGPRRCAALHHLEFDHLIPRAFGGQNTLANLRLLCRAHNNLAAKDLMGKKFIESHYGRD